jgi:hypothetical protein
VRWRVELKVTNDGRFRHGNGINETGPGMNRNPSGEGSRVKKVRPDKDEGARCPFCDAFLIAPDRVRTEAGEFTGGICSCGAVFACDPTGHNLGEAYLDAITFACGGDWSRCYSLSPEENYREAVFSYDLRTHKMRPVNDIRRDHSGKIVFIKIDTVANNK